MSSCVFTLTGGGQAGLPSLSLPPFSVPGNVTDGHTDFFGMLDNIGSDIVIIPLVAVIETVAIAKSFGKPSHMRLMILSN